MARVEGTADSLFKSLVHPADRTSKHLKAPYCTRHVLLRNAGHALPIVCESKHIEVKVDFAFGKARCKLARMQINGLLV